MCLYKRGVCGGVLWTEVLDRRPRVEMLFVGQQDSKRLLWG
jgi:hypothetical protein